MASRPLQPGGIQLAYYAELRAMVARARQLVRERVYPRLPAWLERAAPLHRVYGDFFEPPPGMFHTDAKHKPGQVNAVIDQVEAAFWRVYPQERLERMSAKVAEATDAHQRRQMLQQVRELVGIDLGAVVDRKAGLRVRQFTAENVALIRTVPSDYFQAVEREVLHGVANGDRAETIEAALEEEGGAARNRAALIARDQVLSFQADLNRERQQDLGVESYIWRTSGDERTRVEHAERDGQAYRWDDPPGDPPDDPHTGGHPGEAINCRCWAEPVIPEDLLE